LNLTPSDAACAIQEVKFEDFVNDLGVSQANFQVKKKVLK
jgi:hypothetical protein